MKKKNCVFSEAMNFYCMGGENNFSNIYSQSLFEHSWLRLNDYVSKKILD